MNDKIDLLRVGKFEDRIRRDATIYPALLTFDNIGETPALYKWLHGRCATEGLLQQPGVAPLALIRVDRFEQLMALAARGTSTVKILRSKSAPDSVDRNFDRVLLPFARSSDMLRLPQLEVEFQRIAGDVQEALFGVRS